VDILIQKNISVRMRDGVELATDVYRVASARNLPVLLKRHPYNKEDPAALNSTLDIPRVVQSGYAVVIQDTRGRYRSGGTFNPLFDEATDGADTISWAASQPWSSGRVGMFGASYTAATQWLAATQAPDALKAIAPRVTAADYHEGWNYQGGAFQLGFSLHWTLFPLALGEVLRAIDSQRTGGDALLEAAHAIDSSALLFSRTPLVDLPELNELAPYYFDWLAHPSYDGYWRGIAPREQYERVTVPSLNIGGWFDCFLGGTLEAYCGMKARGGTPEAREPRLLIGPWSHANISGNFPERSFGWLSSASGVDLTGHHLRWFDYFLKGSDNGIGDEPPVTLFVMGANAWRTEQDWPLPDTKFIPYYLHSNGRANSSAGDGQLSPTPPSQEPADAYRYDPLNPVPTVGGATFLPGFGLGINAGPIDQRQLESREDVLCFTTSPLTRPLEVTGPIELVLFVSSSAPDTDFTGKLVDVHPNGRAEILTDGILRARYRDSLTDPSDLQPDTIYELRIDLWATANVFGVGHRLRLDVSSSNFPKFDRNTNTGGIIAEETEADMRPAINRVHHDGAHPSHVILPIIERS